NLHYNSTQKQPTLSTQSGFWMRKSLYEVQQAQAFKYTNAHLILFRLGRSYLNYAEVMLRTGDTPKAIEYINKTRTLHGGLPELSTALTTEDAWIAYKSERRVELFYEGDRYWSLLRWGKYDDLDVIPELNREHHKLEISADGKSYSIIKLPSGTSHSLNTKAFSKRRYFFPIPQKEILLNNKLEGDQNPLW
ncbi:MAG: RagB/SusD family nutrient uptake outer membrane protein, partial [Bacteroidales bacterium]